jgi:hypothetical protein
VLWRSGALALWRSGALVLWCSGALALWRSDVLAFWRFGAQLLRWSATSVLDCCEARSRQGSATLVLGFSAAGPLYYCLLDSRCTFVLCVPRRYSNPSASVQCLTFRLLGLSNDRPQFSATVKFCYSGPHPSLRSASPALAFYFYFLVATSGIDARLLLRVANVALGCDSARSLCA